MDNLSVEKFIKAVKINSYRNELFFKNKILNENEISQKKIILKSKPRGMIVNLTTKCNLKCRMCRVQKFSWEIPRETVSEITEYFPYLEYLSWLGGEVFLSDYFEELFEKAASYPNIRQDITTNGLFIDERWAERLVKANVNLIFSIDGVTKETYEYIRREAKFEDLLKSIDMVNKYKKRYHNISINNIFTIINFVVMKSNYREMEQVVDFAKKNKFDAIAFLPILAETSSENIFYYNDPEALGYIKKIMPIILSKVQNYGINLKNHLPLNENDDKGEQKSYKNDFGFLNTIRTNILCHWPWQSLYINSNGTLMPQCFCKREIGNVGSNSLEEVWNNNRMQLYRRKLLNNDYVNFCNPECISGMIRGWSGLGREAF